MPGRFLLIASIRSPPTWSPEQKSGATATSQNAISNNYNANTVEPDDNHQFDVKGDYQITARAIVSSRANRISVEI